MHCGGFIRPANRHGIRHRYASSLVSGTQVSRHPARAFRAACAFCCSWPKWANWLYSCYISSNTAARNPLPATELHQVQLTRCAKACAVRAFRPRKARKAPRFLRPAPRFLAHRGAALHILSQCPLALRQTCGHLLPPVCAHGVAWRTVWWRDVWCRSASATTTTYAAHSAADDVFGVCDGHHSQDGPVFGSRSAAGRGDTG